MGQIICAISKGFFEATSFNYDSLDKLSAAIIQEGLWNTRKSYSLLPFQFVIDR